MAMAMDRSDTKGPHTNKSKVAINFASEDELVKIPGVSKKVAAILLSIRGAGGDITGDILSAICCKKFTGEELDMIDFSPNEVLEEFPRKQEALEYHTVASEGEGSLDKSFRSLDQSFFDFSEPKPGAVKPDVARGSAGVKSTSVFGRREGRPVMGGDSMGYNGHMFTTPRVPQAIPADFGSERSLWKEQGTTSLGDNEFEPLSHGGWEPVYPVTARSRLSLDKMPTNLTFDGNGSWEAFIFKFSRYAEMCQWSNEDKLCALCLTLEGKALDYYVILHNSGEVQSYASLYDKLEARFGDQISPEAAQGQFYQAFQNPGESLDDFADRLRALADKAFQGVCAQFITSQVISRFCHGLLDQQAGFHVYMHDPSTVEQAKLLVRKYQQSHEAIFGRSKRSERCEGKRVSSVSTDSYEVHSDEDNSSVTWETVIEAIEELEDKFEKAFTVD